MRFITIGLMMISFTSLSQEPPSSKEQTTKRPSWSTGLPEKTSTPNRSMPKPGLRANERNHSDLHDSFGVSNNIEMSTLSTGMDPSIAKPQISIHQASKTIQLTHNSQTQTIILETQKVNNSESHEPVEQESVSPDLSSKPNKNTPQLKPSTSYDWKINRKLPIKVPKTLALNQDSLLVKIFINANGNVVGVESVTSDTSETLLTHAKRSINRWRFESPQTQGISANILSKVFKVELLSKG